MKDPVKPLDPAILDQTIVKTYQRQSDESGRERERELGSECDNVGRLDHAPGWHKSAHSRQTRFDQRNCSGGLLTEIPDMAIPAIVFVRKYDHNCCCDGEYLIFRQNRTHY